MTTTAEAPAHADLGAARCVLTPTAARPRPGVVAGESLGVAQAAVARAAAVSMAALSNPDLTAAAQDLAALKSQVQALSLAVLAEARERGQHGPVGEQADVDPAAWWGRLTGDPAEVIRGGLLIARLLSTRYHHIRAGLETGRLRLSQAKVLVRAAERAPSALSPEQITAAEESLVLTATGQGTTSGRPMPAKALRAEARRVFAGMLPTQPEAEAAEGDDVAAEEDRAERECYLSMGDCGDGTWRGSFRLPDLHARILQAALEHLTRPRRHTHTQPGHPDTETGHPDTETSPTGPASSHAGGSHRGAGGSRPAGTEARTAAGPGSSAGSGSTRVVDESAELNGPSYGANLGSAFCELLEHLPFDRLPGSAMTLLIKIDLHTLRVGAGTAHLDQATPISARNARRAACTASHLPVVLAGASLPLDAGRTRRLYSSAQSTTLAAAYDTCAITGCTRPYAWCELHHLLEWAHGGATDLRNALPLCGYHHRRAHDPGYHLTHHTGIYYRLRKRR